MASSKLALSAVSELTSCPICFETYSSSARLPKVLSCQHSLFLQCLQSLSDKSLDRTELTCPTCRAGSLLPPDGPAAVPNNLTVLALLGYMDTMQATTPEGAEPAHDGKAAGGNGQEEEAPEAPACLCDQHDNLPAQFVCLDCMLTLCEECKSTHGEHKVKHVQNVYTNAKMELDELKVLAEWKAKRMGKNCQGVVTDLCKTMEKNIDDLEKMEEVYIQKIKCWKEKAINLLKEKLERDISDVNTKNKAVVQLGEDIKSIKDTRVAVVDLVKACSRVKDIVKDMEDYNDQMESAEQDRWCKKCVSCLHKLADEIDLSKNNCLEEIGKGLIDEGVSTFVDKITYSTVEKMGQIILERKSQKTAGNIRLFSSEDNKTSCAQIFVDKLNIFRLNGSSYQLANETQVGQDISESESVFFTDADHLDYQIHSFEDTIVKYRITFQTKRLDKKKGVQEEVNKMNAILLAASGGTYVYQAFKYLDCDYIFYTSRTFKDKSDDCWLWIWRSASDCTAMKDKQGVNVCYNNFEKKSSHVCVSVDGATVLVLYDGQITMYNGKGKHVRSAEYLTKHPRAMCMDDGGHIFILHTDGSEKGVHVLKPDLTHCIHVTMDQLQLPPSAEMSWCTYIQYAQYYSTLSSRYGIFQLTFKCRDQMGVAAYKLK